MLKERMYQVRQFGGTYPEFSHKEEPVYSVICHVNENGKNVLYEHVKYKDLPYAEALRLANVFENNKILPNLKADWLRLDAI